MAHMTLAAMYSPSGFGIRELMFHATLAAMYAITSQIPNPESRLGHDR